MERGTGVNFNALFSNVFPGMISAGKQGISFAVARFSDRFGQPFPLLYDVPFVKHPPAHFQHKQHVKHYNTYPQIRPDG